MKILNILFFTLIISNNFLFASSLVDNTKVESTTLNVLSEDEREQAIVDSCVFVLDELLKSLDLQLIAIDNSWKLEKKNIVEDQRGWKKIDYRVYNATGIFGGMISISTPKEGGPYGVTNIYTGDYPKYHQGRHRFPAKITIETKKGTWELKIKSTEGNVEILVEKSDLDAKDSMILSGCSIASINRIK